MRSKLPADLRNKWRPVYHAALEALKPAGIPVTLNGTDHVRISAVLRHSRGDHEPDVWNRLMDAVRPGDVCLDIGANIGWYTLGFANRLRGNGQVFSFEPDFASYQTLQRHIALNRLAAVVCAMNIAVGDRDGVLRFVSGSGPFSHAAGPEDAATSSVACFRLDTVFSGLDATPDILKIDVEGFELQVLRGARELLTRSARPRLIYMDVHPWAWPKLGLDTTVESLTRFLSDIGYRFELRTAEFADLFAWPA